MYRLLINLANWKAPCLSHTQRSGPPEPQTHHLLYVSSLTLLKTAAQVRKVTVLLTKSKLSALAVWQLAGLPRVNHQILPCRPPSTLLACGGAGPRQVAERTRLRTKGPFRWRWRDRLGPPSRSLLCSMASFLPLIIFGFTKGNVDFLLQGSFFKIRHLLSNFFATSAPRAQGEGG